jgi:hypothetical protein
MYKNRIAMVRIYGNRLFGRQKYIGWCVMVINLGSDPPSPCPEGTTWASWGSGGKCCESGKIDFDSGNCMPKSNNMIYIAIGIIALLLLGKR